MTTATGNPCIPASNVIDLQEAIDALLTDGRVTVEDKTFFADDRMQSVRFQAETHASEVRFMDKVTLIYSTESEGRLKTCMDGAHGQHDIEPGMMHFIPEEVLQEYEFCGSTRNTMVVFDASLLRSVRETNPEFRDVPIDEPRFPFRSPRLARKMNALTTLAAHQDIGWRSLAEACRIEIAVELLKVLVEVPGRGTRPLGKDELVRVRDFADAEMENNIGLEDVAALVGRDFYGFGRAFKESTGATFHQYLTQLRVEKARELITGTQMQLSEIAYACGFSSQSHMTTVIGRHVGVTPGALRQRARA